MKVLCRDSEAASKNVLGRLETLTAKPLQVDVDEANIGASVVEPSRMQATMLMTMNVDADVDVDVDVDVMLNVDVDVECRCRC